MTQRVALCVDESTCRNPELMGLDGERLGSQKWLSVFSRGGEEARSGIGGDRAIGQAWVVSCDDVEPINLAASIKSDRPDLRVSLVTSEGCGSLFSRAHTARIDEVLQHNAFLRNYEEAKGRLGGLPDHEGPSPQPSPARRDAQKTSPLSLSAFSGASAIAIGDETTRLLERPRVTAKPDNDHAAQLVAYPQKAPAKTPSRAFLLPVVSGSGGAGKSSVAVMTALAASEMGYETLLLDYDLQFGDIALLAGTDNPLEIDTAMNHPDQLERELRRSRKPAVLAAPARIETAEEVVRGMPAFLEMLCSKFDVIVANTGAAWAEQHAVLLERASAALFLIDQRTSSLRACKHALELCARCGIATSPFQFAVNRCSKGSALTSIDVSCALQGASVFEIKDGGRDVEECLASGSPQELVDLKNDFAKSVEQVVTRLLPAEGNRLEDDAGEGIIGRSMRRKRHAGRRRGRRTP